MDLRLELDDRGAADLMVVAGDLAFGHALRNAVLVSIFCDARAAEPAPVGSHRRSDDVRGYWADSAGDRWGSRLWEVLAEPLTPTSPAAAAEAAELSLAWLVQDGAAKTIEVAATRIDKTILELVVTIVRPDPPLYEDDWNDEDVVEMGPVRVRVLVR